MANRQYPKPLSEKVLQKKYAELKLSDEKIDFLKNFILACTNLYGCIPLRDAWEVYKELSEKTDVPKIKRVDLVHISEVLRREELPYFVYEIDELYDEETRAELDREFVSRYLIENGHGKFRWYYVVAEAQACHDYNVPENLLSFAAEWTPLQEQSLLSFVGKLKVTQTEYKDCYGEQKKKCSGHIGETLDSFSFMNDSERFLYQYENGEMDGHKGNPKKAKRLLDENNSMTEAQKIVSRLKWYGNIGHVRPHDMIRYTLDELNEVGVALAENQMDKFINKIMDFHNNSNLMCLKGWRPVDLMQHTDAPPAISFGPGIRQAIAEGKLDKDDMIKMIRSMGFDFIDE